MIDRFTKEAKSRWTLGEVPEGDVVISSRIRLARNVNGIPFPGRASEIQAGRVMEMMEELLGLSTNRGDLGDFELVKLAEADFLDRQVLMEKHLISRDLLAGRRHQGVLIKGDESATVMINEEDHLRLQVLLPGLALQETWKTANRLDDIIEAKVDYAFDEHKGYLTACPTNVGTGIRVSTLMHLPALFKTNQMPRVLQTIAHLGLIVRGFYGEGTEALGNIFQVSNQITLGYSEEEIIGSVDGVVGQIITHERNARHHLLSQDKLKLEDQVHRSLALLKGARLLTSKESMSLISDVRMGVNLGLIEGIRRDLLNELLILVQPGYVQKQAGKQLSEQERDKLRAELVRGALHAA